MKDERRKMEEKKETRKKKEGYLQSQTWQAWP